MGTRVFPSYRGSENPKIPQLEKPRERDFLKHLEAYLAKRDGVDKLLKISRYATKIILASSIIPSEISLNRRLKSFESSVGVSRKAFRLGKFVQDLNALRDSKFDSKENLVLAILAYGGEGLYYFIEHFVWLSKTGLIDSRNSSKLQKMSAWAEFIGYVGSIALKFKDLRKIIDAEARLRATIMTPKEVEVIERLREKQFMKKLSIIQDFADGLMAIVDIRDGKGIFSSPLLVASAGLLSALISTHKNWLSC